MRIRAAAPDPGLFQIERVDIGRPSVGHEDVRNVQPGRLAGGLDRNADALAARLNFSDRGIGEDFDPLLAHAVDDDSGKLRIHPGEGLTVGHQRDLRAQPIVGLGQFKRFRRAADDQQMRQAARVVIDRFRREVRDALEPGQYRRHRAGTGGDDKGAGGDPVLAGDHRLGVGEPRFGDQHLDPERFEVGDGGLGGEPGDDFLNAVVNLAGVDPRRFRRDAEGRGVPHGMGVRRRGRERPGWNGAVEQVAAAEAMALHQRHAGAQPPGFGCRAETSEAAADDAQVDRDRFRQECPFIRPIPPPCGLETQ